MLRQVVAARSAPLEEEVKSNTKDDARLSAWTAAGRSDSSAAIRMFARFCDDVSVDARAVRESFEKMLVVSQKNITVRAAFASCFGADAFIDWERVESMWTDRPYLDSVAWVQAMGFLVVSDKGVMDLRALLREHAPLRHFDECVRSSGLAVDAWATVALYLLIHVRQLQTLHAVELFYSTHFKRGVRREALAFFGEIANKQFDHESQTRALVALMRACVGVRAEEMQLELELMRNQSLELDALFHQKLVRAMVGRPRLRSKLKQLANGGGLLFVMDRLDHWSGSIRFPNVFSMQQRKRLYFVMSQCHLTPVEFMADILPDRDLGLTVLNYPVKQPDVDVIHQCIAEMRVVSDPFPELHQFRARCFDSFAQEHKSRLRLNDLLHLYVAAYQTPAIWKSVWKLVFPVLSIQIIRDVEMFVDRMPFARRAVLAIMFDRPILGTGPFAAGRDEEGSHPVHDDGVVGQTHDALDGVRHAEGARLQALEERADEAAPLEHQMLRRAEPPMVDALVPGERFDPALALPADTEDVVHEEPWDPLLHEEAPAEGGARGTGYGQLAKRVGGEAHVD